MNTLPNETTIRNLPFFADKTIEAIMPVSHDPMVLNATVHTADQKYFVKIRNPQRDRYHHVDVRSEFAAIRAVGEAGLGPRAFFCSAEQQTIVMEFLDGSAFDVPGITSQANLPRAAQAIQKLHSLAPCGGSYNIEDVLVNYLVALDGHPLLLPEHVAGVRAVLSRCAKSAASARWVLCHGDLASHNIFESNGIKFIDLEMVGVNDLHFDLATFFLFNGLNPDQQRQFLGVYGAVDCDRLADTKYAVLARDGLWAISEMVSGRVNEVYPRIAEYCFQRIAALA